MGITRSGRLYENPATTDKGKAPATEVETRPRTLPTPSKKVTEEEAGAFMKIIKASEYKVVEQMAKSSAHISLLALLLNSEPHREALMRHIVCKCNNHIVGRVMIDNGSALNVCPVTTLKQMNVDLNRIRPSKTAVRAFDGSRREVNGEIDLLIDIGPCSFSVTFQVLDIPNAFSLLLGRPWIHSVGAIPSSLHQKESLRRLEDHQLTSLEPTEEINVGTEEEPRILKIGTSLDPTQWVRMIDFLTRYQEVFARSYAEMPGLDPSIVKHFLPLDIEKFPPKRQQLRREYKLRLNPAKCTFGARSGKLPPPSSVREKAFDTIKAYLVQPPVLVLSTPGRPLVLYLTVRRQSLGCMLGQEEESTHTERAIYYLSKKFTDGESNYPKIKKMCCALVWVMQRLRQYTLYHTTLGQWKTKDAKLVPYHEYLEKLTENFEDVSFTYTPHMTNQFADALATLASM
ncbi:hypothetical protein CRG98_034697, partial [Punica granatum]